MYLIVSDLHGNISAYEKVLTVAERIKPEKIVFCGDMCDGNGFIPVNAVLNNIWFPLVAVMGNCDTPQTFEKLKLGRQCTYYTETYKKRQLFFTHGHFYNDSFIPPILGYGDVLFYGHYHIPSINKVDNVTCVCVGSMGHPRSGFPATYVLFDGDSVDIYDAETDKKIDGIILEKV